MPKALKRTFSDSKRILAKESSDEDEDREDFTDSNHAEGVEASETDSDSEHSSDDDDGDMYKDNEVSDSEDERTAIRKELSSLTFAELEALKSKIGTKEWNEAMFGSKPQSSKSAQKKRRKDFKRENKNRPREMSAKIKRRRVREIVPVKKTRSRDPRFEDLCGEYDEKIWAKNYEFIKELRQKEIQDLRAKVKEATDEKSRNEIKRNLQKLVNKEKSDAVKKEKQEKEKMEREENIQRLKEGKKPFFMKKSTKKYVELAEKYDKLKASGKLESYLKKKRKKNATRDRKTLPSKV